MIVFPSFFPVRRIWVFLAAILVGACSTKKNTFLSRSVHSVGARYNVLYNGNVALEEGKKALIASYTDNYWDLLPVERLTVEEEAIIPNKKAKNPQFGKAEEKAVKAIQKHGMNIEGKEYNSQMDEAYLLLGKARYYDQRFVPALEAFNYVLYKYWMSDRVNEVRIWREKTNLRLENETLALKNLKRLLRLEKPDAQEYADAHAVMAQAYMNLHYLDSAVQKLTAAAAATRHIEEKGRYYFITGQLYNRLELPDSAAHAFEKVIELNRSIPYIYLLNARLEKLKIETVHPVAEVNVLEALAKLEKNYENHTFLDKIYRVRAFYYTHIDSLDRTEEYLNRSLRAATTDKYLKALNYEDLAQMRFDAARYVEAGRYYDSTLVNLSKDTEKYRVIEKKKKNLAAIITYETIVQKTDSILRLVAMSEAERMDYFEAYIKRMKEAEAKKTLSQEQRTDKPAPLPAASLKNTKNIALFYFYNPVTLQYGKNEFRKVWGDRKWENNWRFSDKKSITLDSAVTAASQKAIEEKYDVRHYLASVPLEQPIIDSLQALRNTAYYKLGLLYKEKIKDYPLAAQKLETLLTYKPPEQLSLPAHYHLYRVYEKLQSPLAQSSKDSLLIHYPNSRYAAFLKDAGTTFSETTETPEGLYIKLFKTYERGEYDRVVEEIDGYLLKFSGEPIVPKLEMLKAHALARLKGLEAYKQALKAIAVQYPEETEGKEAEMMLKEKLKPLEHKTFSADSLAGNWKLVFPVQRTDLKTMDKLLTTLEKSLKDLHYEHLKISKDVYDDTLFFIVVHGFKSEDYAGGYMELIKTNKKYRVTNKNFVISSPNYTIVQVHKNMLDYVGEKQKS